MREQMLFESKWFGCACVDRVNGGLEWIATLVLPLSPHVQVLG